LGFVKRALLRRFNVSGKRFLAFPSRAGDYVKRTITNSKQNKPSEAFVRVLTKSQMGPRVLLAVFFGA
jgi:hypothetical protein